MTLVEMILTIVLFTAIASMGALLISKLTPSYLVSTQEAETLAPREAALWRLAEDFRQALLDGTTQVNCVLTLTRASGVEGTYGQTPSTHLVAYEWYPGLRELWVSDTATSSLLLNNVDPQAGNCPFSYASGVERARLLVNFKHTNGLTDPVDIPVSTVYYSFVNGPYVASAVFDAAFSRVSVVGYFPGLGSGGNYALAMTSGVATAVSATVTSPATAQILANVTPIASAVIDVKVTTPEGFSILKRAFQFP